MLLNRYRGSGGEDGKALQMDGSDGDPMGMRSVPLNQTLGNGEGGELHVPCTSPPHKQPKLFQIFLFIYFYLGGCAGSSWLCVRSLVATSRGYSPPAGFRLPPAAPAAAAQRLQDPAAHGILLPQGSNPCPLHWQADSEPPDHQGSP